MLHDDGLIVFGKLDLGEDPADVFLGVVRDHREHFVATGEHTRNSRFRR